MNTNRICLILLLTILAHLVFAEEKTIVVNTAEWERRERSIFNIPELSHDKETISIYTSIRLENLEITVRNSTGLIIYSEVVVLQKGQRYSFSIEQAEYGESMIELKQGHRYLFGYFDVNE